MPDLSPLNLPLSPSLTGHRLELFMTMADTQSLEHTAESNIDGMSVTLLWRHHTMPIHRSHTAARFSVMGPALIEALWG